MSELKLFVWENVLSDYTSGIVCILARNEEEAWELLYKEDSTAWWDLQGEPMIKSSKFTSHSEAAFKKLKGGPAFKFDKAISPKVVLEPEAFVLWGGG